MREILFRGVETDREEWVYGYLIHDSICNSTVPYIGYLSHEQADTENRDIVPVIPETVGQFTGLTDKNGKKIFEGDIIHVNYTISVPVGAGPLLRIVKHSIDYKSVVAFDNCRFFLKKQNGEIFEMHLVPGEIEVIGNIHDNPDLLEADK